MSNIRGNTISYATKQIKTSEDWKQVSLTRPRKNGYIILFYDIRFLYPCIQNNLLSIFQLFQNFN